MGVLESLEQIEFLSHPVPPHQLLVHVFDRHRTFGAALVTALDDRETTPGEKENRSVLTSDTCSGCKNMNVLNLTYQQSVLKAIHCRLLPTDDACGDTF